MGILNYQKLALQEPKFPSTNAYSYIDGDFGFKITFNWKNSSEFVNEIQYEIINSAPQYHLYEFDNARVCCQTLNGTKNLYFLMMNFKNVETVNEVSGYKIGTFTPQCNLKMEIGSVIFIKFNTYTPNEIPYDSCSIPIFDENPKTKDGSIIVSVGP
ncbi:hypothetical protein [Flavivirga jejuensis]|uniref:Uncharacterized protein n=1 Tax=Flavivirga jejuensis TaxID=870487 RepID=A0ABT8WLF6_9FLAO|nr:hypothetical protein [Flavivirga jejuensis]MDO5973987.1 hypothetical protein [Flavivirga jejuensis]